MNIARKHILQLLAVLLLSLLFVEASCAATQFYLLPKDARHRIDCDYLKIENRQAICTDNSLLIILDLVRVADLEVMHAGKLLQIDTFTEETINIINGINANKIRSRQAGGQELKEKEQAKPAFWESDIAQKLSFTSFSDFVQSLKGRYEDRVGYSTVNLILLGSGFVVFLTGSILYIITTFRVGILWGLGCMLLPFVSFIFLFVHWKVAAKPFFLSMLGVGLIFSATLLVPAGGAV